MWQQASPTTTPEKEMAFVTRLTVLICDMKREGEGGSVVPDSLRLHGLYSPWNSSGQNTGMDSPSLFQGILPTQGSNPGFPHCGQILYQLSHKGSPSIQEWVGYSISRGSSRPRNQTRVMLLWTHPI